MSLNTDSFYELQPETILKAADSFGKRSTGRLIQLNSYENRVYQVDFEDDKPLIAKFYRPGRWTKAQIQEEHDFLRDLQLEGVPVVSPIEIETNQTIGVWGNLFFSFFPKQYGRMPQELLEKDFESVGKTLAHLHNVAGRSEFKYRQHLDGQDHGWDDLEVLGDFVDPSLWLRYEDAAVTIINSYIDKVEAFGFQRIHGDCHRGNLLNNENDYFMVDFDDAVMGPVAQDFWMLCAGPADEQKQQLEFLLKGYEKLRTFDSSQLELFEPLRGIRIIHYAAWIGKRWSDPSFPRLFPNYMDYSYWAEEVEALEKISWSL